jgi:hypothetical protein
MQLTQDQLETVRSGRAVRLTELGTELIVLRADVFANLQALMYDDSGWTDSDMAILAAEDADQLGWEGMEDYQDNNQ